MPGAFFAGAFVMPPDKRYGLIISTHMSLIFFIKKIDNFLSSFSQLYKNEFLTNLYFYVACVLNHSAQSDICLKKM